MELRKVAQSGQSFMMAVGFIKPHLPLNAPKKYWDLYPEEEIELAPNPNFPKNMPEIAFSGHPNFYNYDYGEYESLSEGQPMPDKTAKHLRHAYRAATSYVDAQVGKVLNELKKLGLEDNTAIVLWGDHGWHLGDAGHWGKQTNFEYAARSPMLVKVPWFDTKNLKTDALVETVDILPTLLDLCELPPLQVCDGQSLKSFLQKPEGIVKNAAYHVFNRHALINGERKQIIGHAVRNDRYRFISWRIGWGLNGDEYAAELYDYAQDPLETINAVDDPEYREVKLEMEKLLRNGPAGVKYNF